MLCGYSTAQCGHPDWAATRAGGLRGGRLSGYRGSVQQYGTPSEFIYREALECGVPRQLLDWIRDMLCSRCLETDWGDTSVRGTTPGAACREVSFRPFCGASWWMGSSVSWMKRAIMPKDMRMTVWSYSGAPIWTPWWDSQGQHSAKWSFVEMHQGSLWIRRRLTWQFSRENTRWLKSGAPCFVERGCKYVARWNTWGLYWRGKWDGRSIWKRNAEGSLGPSGYAKGPSGGCGLWGRERLLGSIPQSA